MKTPILDIGCGVGYFSELLSRDKKQITAIDINSRNFPRKSRSVTYLKMDGKKIDFDDNYFQSVLIINVLSCIIDSQQERKAVLKEAQRVKIKEGKIYLVLMAEELYDKSFESDLLITCPLDNNMVRFDFKKSGGKQIPSLIMY